MVVGVEDRDVRLYLYTTATDGVLHSCIKVCSSLREDNFRRNDLLPLRYLEAFEKTDKGGLRVLHDACEMSTFMLGSSVKEMESDQVLPENQIFHSLVSRVYGFLQASNAVPS